MELRNAGAVVASTVTRVDGTFVVERSTDAAKVVVSLAGFQTVTVTCSQSARIVLPLAAATDNAEVIAAAGVTDSPNATAMISQISGTNLQRLPVPRKHARDALPLLPSVLRGPDGLLRIDGTRPHEAPLLLDGFEVSDPATGLSAIDLPVESVRRVEVLRDPTDVALGAALGSMASIESRTGGDTFEAGVEEFVPRPRLTGGGFGQIEGFSPRVYLGGSGVAGHLKYFVSAESDLERTPVPGVTTSSGAPDSKATGGRIFARVDIQLSKRHSVTAEGLWSPAETALFGLSPLRPAAAAPHVASRDAFAGLTDRRLFDRGDVLTMRVGVLAHETSVVGGGADVPTLTPLGWSGASFSSLEQSSRRLEVSAAWQRRLITVSGVHEIQVKASLGGSRLVGNVAEQDVRVLDDGQRPVREIRFGPSSATVAEAFHSWLAVRDLWKATDQLQIDFGLRADWNSLAGSAPTGRVGFRWALDAAGATVVKASVGRFVAALPLSVPAFGGYPTRLDRSYDAESGALITSNLLRPSVGKLALPRALAANVAVERQIARGWDGLLGASMRRANRLPTLHLEPGTLAVVSDGRSTYWQVEGALRRSWGRENQVFVSYVRSSTRGNLNDFTSVFATGDTEIVRPDVSDRLAADAPNRWLAWGTVDLPSGFTVSAAMEWHSGFPYSLLDARRDFAGPPNAVSFPAFFSLDLTLLKAVRIFGKHLKLGPQVYNATNHHNPRDVFLVAGATQIGSFVNSVGPTLRGVMVVSW